MTLKKYSHKKKIEHLPLVINKKAVGIYLLNKSTKNKKLKIN